MRKYLAVFALIVVSGCASSGGTTAASGAANIPVKPNDLSAPIVIGNVSPAEVYLVSSSPDLCPWEDPSAPGHIIPGGKVNYTLTYDTGCSPTHPGPWYATYGPQNPNSSNECTFNMTYSPSGFTPGVSNGANTSCTFTQNSNNPGSFTAQYINVGS